ncbi:nitroreductase family protein [uncultured Algimonas sp.]|uniref:nitroreductase family protein n=1 Tax=uncultured Algimonas sp. TaxID=1547920 RepID=UPI00262C3479|nr:nitroreductase family protein [uncultured Algimonas sp.]
MSAEAVPLTGYERLPESDMADRLASFQDLMAKRRTIRDFADTPVPRQLIEQAIRVAGTAPSGANHQPWHFVAISDPKTKTAIRQAAEEEERAFYHGRASDEWLDALEPLGTDDQKPFLETAPWLIAVFAQKRGDLGKNYYVTESVGLATGLLITALHSVGLGTLTHTPAPMTFLREICGRPNTEKPFVLLVVGYPAEGCKVPSYALEKKPLSEIVTFKTQAPSP